MILPHSSVWHSLIVFFFLGISSGLGSCLPLSLSLICSPIIPLKKEVTVSGAGIFHFQPIFQAPTTKVGCTAFAFASHWKHSFTLVLSFVNYFLLSLSASRAQGFPGEKNVDFIAFVGSRKKERPVLFFFVAIFSRDTMVFFAGRGGWSCGHCIHTILDMCTFAT